MCSPCKEKAFLNKILVFAISSRLNPSLNWIHIASGTIEAIHRSGVQL